MLNSRPTDADVVGTPRCCQAMTLTVNGESSSRWSPTTAKYQYSSAQVRVQDISAPQTAASPRRVQARFASARPCMKASNHKRCPTKHYAADVKALWLVQAQTPKVSHTRGLKPFEFIPTPARRQALARSPVAAVCAPAVSKEQGSGRHAIACRQLGVVPIGQVNPVCARGWHWERMARACPIQIPALHFFSPPSFHLDRGLTIARFGHLVGNSIVSETQRQRRGRRSPAWTK